MQITKTDLLWNYGATFLKIASSILLLPLILRLMPSEMVGIWTVFMTITAFSVLLDFGFNPSFSRNITYVFSGVDSIKTHGVAVISNGDTVINYSLLKGVISAMRWFYLRMSILLFLILISLGTWYISSLLHNYKGIKVDVYIAWGLLCIINTYNIYTLYYDSLLLGKGLVKRSKQIIIIGNLIYLIIAALFLLTGKGLIAIVSAQASSVIIIRWLSYKSFFTNFIKQQLQDVMPYSKVEILKAIFPNALKIGLTSLGGFMVQRSAMVIGSLYLSLEEIASYGITMQLIAVLVGLAGIFTATFQPRIAQLRVEQKSFAIKELYLKGQIVLFVTFIIGGLGLLLFGEKVLDLIGSKTTLISQGFIFVVIIIAFLESNHSIAGSILLSNNEVPFFKASLIAGGTTIILLLIMLQIGHMKLLAMILAPGIAHLYNNWKWPYEVVKQLNISFIDVRLTIKNFSKINLNGN